MSKDTRLTRREVLKSAATVVASMAGTTLLTSAYSGSSTARAATPKVGASGKPLVISMVGGTWKDWQDECFARPFTRETGVKVLWDVMTPAAIIASMASAKKANKTPIHHISKMDQFDIEFADKQGLTSKLDKSIVTNWKDIHPSVRTDSWMTSMTNHFAPTWNKDKVKKDINSWFDMWDVSFKGKVAIPVFEWIGWPWLCAMNTILGPKPDNVDPVFTKLDELVRDVKPKFMNSVEHGNQMFESGEIWIAPFWDGRTRNLQDKGLPLIYKYPKEGAVINASGYVINRDLKENGLEANLFMQMVGNPEAQLCLARKSSYPPSNTSLTLPPELRRIHVSKEDLDKMIKVSYAAYEPIKGQCLDRWNRLVTKSG